VERELLRVMTLIGENQARLGGVLIDVMEAIDQGEKVPASADELMDQATKTMKRIVKMLTDMVIGEIK